MDEKDMTQSSVPGIYEVAMKIFTVISGIDGKVIELQSGVGIKQEDDAPFAERGSLDELYKVLDRTLARSGEIRKQLDNII